MWFTVVFVIVWFCVCLLCVVHVSRCSFFLFVCSFLIFLVIVVVFVFFLFLAFRFCLCRCFGFPFFLFLLPFLFCFCFLGCVWPLPKALPPLVWGAVRSCERWESSCHSPRHWQNDDLKSTGALQALQLHARRCRRKRKVALASASRSNNLTDINFTIVALVERPMGSTCEQL